MTKWHNNNLKYTGQKLLWSNAKCHVNVDVVSVKTITLFQMTETVLLTGVLIAIR